MKTSIARRIALAMAISCAIAVFASTAARGAPGAAGGGRPGVMHRVESASRVRSYWTPERMRAAKPMPLVQLSSDGTATEPGGASPAATDPSAQGTDTGDPTVFPNSANGDVFFKFGSTPARCSGSVIDSPTGNLVLTAAHCVVNDGSGINATNVVFVPGYRDGVHTLGDWPAKAFFTPPQWQATASTGSGDQAGDIAILELANRGDGASAQSVVGAVGIAFNRSRLQTYSEYGYPGGFPYDGSRLYRLTAPWGADDPAFSPPPIGISSDFTNGSSGGPWLVGKRRVAMSITAYRYDSGPLSGYEFGPYFGGIAQNLYATARAQALADAPPASNAFKIKRLGRNRHRGIVVLGIDVPGAGQVVLTGRGLRAQHKAAGTAGPVVLRVRAKGSRLARLRRAGRLRVHVTVVFRPTGGSPASKGRDVLLILR